MVKNNSDEKNGLTRGGDIGRKRPCNSRLRARVSSGRKKKKHVVCEREGVRCNVLRSLIRTKEQLVKEWRVGGLRKTSGLEKHEHAKKIHLQLDGS